MTSQLDIAVLVGSLRKGSLNRKLAYVLADLVPTSLALDIVEIGELPHYNEDDETQLPVSWAKFRKRMAIDRKSVV